jgi:hydroxymethylbilane synthase
MLPAVGQGALGLETRAEDHETAHAIRVLNDSHAEACVRAEREVLRILRAGCLAPVAAYASLEHGTMVLRAKVFSVDGSVMVSAWVRHAFEPPNSDSENIQSQNSEPPDRTPESLARTVTEKLIEQGADRLIESKV